ncbi:MAG TPA: YqiA/YcfP family alpha/beta fold hydrolase [Candidatus Binatia bacterium]|nr:YqiA/YcfP family alpha/beta fold hydrolase [Candidatus Binatia bacterium]
MTAAYLHGFASGPASTKARFFRARLAERGLALAVPDLAPDFTHVTVSGMLGIVEPLLAQAPTVLLGSSLGGYLAALAAARAPARVPALVLFAPAFDFARRWEERLGSAALARWRAAGTTPVMHYGLGREVPLAIALLDDARAHPAWPDPPCPALVFAGRRDDAVPLAAVERFAAARPNRELVVLDAGHELTEVLEPMWERTAAFLARQAAV